MAEPIPYRQEVFRKLIHLSSLWMVIVIAWYPGERIHLTYFFGTLLILNLLCEFAYSCGVPIITPLYKTFFGRMLRADVKRGQWVVSGGPPVFAAATLVSFLFLPSVAATALGIMLIADTAAALIGRRFGRHKCANGKSWEGVFAFWVSGTFFGALMLVLTHRFHFWMLVATGLAVLLSAAAELYEKQLRMDDNFSIPLISGFVIAVAGKFFL